MSLSNRQIKLINYLHSKKGRKENLKFLVEGEKVINELLASDWKIDFIVMNEIYKDRYEKHEHIYFLKEDEVSKLSSLKTNTFGIAIAEMKTITCDFSKISGSFVYLDGIRDPGNLGTIIRICDWYGINQLFVSPDTTEFYNPKTIIATMGSFTRVNVTIIELEELKSFLPNFKFIGTFLEGKSIYQYPFSSNQIIVLGNESNGIRPEVTQLLDDQLTIPKVGGAESLNVGISTAIVLDNIFRKSSF